MSIEETRSSEFLHQTALGRLAHDLAGATGVVSNAVDELAHGLGGQDAAANEKLLALARRGVAKLRCIADRCAVLSEADKPHLAEADLGVLATRAMEVAAAAFGKRTVTVSPPAGHVSLEVDPRLVSAAITDATMLALVAARSRVTSDITREGTKVTLRVEADNDASSLATAWQEKTWERQDGAGGDHVLAMRLIARVMRAHEGSADVKALNGTTTIRLHFHTKPPTGGAA